MTGSLSSCDVNVKMLDELDRPLDDVDAANHRRNKDIRGKGKPKEIRTFVRSKVFFKRDLYIFFKHLALTYFRF
jgi:hypothetical protein